MLPELSEIRRRRAALGISQAALAKNAGVSQSLVAKTEAGKLVPSYENAKRVFDFFESLRPEAGLTAKDVMSKKVKSISPSASVKAAAMMMKRSGISQLPVVVDGRPVGTVSERLVIDRMQHGKNLEEFGATPLGQIMDDTLPAVNEDAPLDAVSALLESSQAVLVTKKGILCGIISRSDLFGQMLKKH
ncbi:MAG: CBS domain-containing protein [Candidatus Diapherotrites archaeon]|nr:CBS domain-containing protein [Candidatus Diapherotrites archaeon]